MALPDTYRDPRQVGETFDSPVITIGNFDGGHLGHLALFRRALEWGRTLERPSLAVTFSPHPVRFFRPDADEFRLTTDDERSALVHEAGLDGLVVIDFSEVADLAPEDFVETVIHRQLDASCVIVGANFAFGQGRAGTTEDLRRLTDARDIACDIHPKLELDGEPVSSTRIRERLREGEIRRASHLLGRHYRLTGTIVQGEQRGRELGYPTANLDPDHLVPDHGVYVTRLHREHETRGQPAATSIGIRPVFDEPQRTIESYVLDADEDLDLYGEHVTLEFIERLRGERDFESVEALVEQMDRDVAEVRRHLRLRD